MRHFSNLEDLQSLNDDPDLQREMYGFMSFCLAELLEYTDEEDLVGHDLNFQLATHDDLEEIRQLGVPEETAIIDLHCDGKSRRIRRLIFVSTVVFVDAQQIPSGEFSSNSETTKQT